MMTEPMRTPDGNIIDKAALVDWLMFSNTDPITGTPLDLADCKTCENLQEQIFKEQCQALSTAQLGLDTSGNGSEKPLRMTPEKENGKKQGSLLGDLPDLPVPQSPSSKKDKEKIRITSRNVIDAPDQFRCAIDGKVMINPLKSPYGHSFERKTLERWISSCGSVCPITGKPLRLQECETDSHLKKSIVNFLRGRDG